MNIKRFEDIVMKLENPQVFTGKEINVCKKGFLRENLNICLVFPDKYEIGMSHNGIKILYHMLNSMDGISAERCFVPERSTIDFFKEEGIPLFSIESKTPLKNFDLVCFSLLSEMNFTNILQILESAQIPLRSEHREGTFPLIGAGGISAINPEPLRYFIDFFAFGDGEVVLRDLVLKFTELFRQGEFTKEKLTDVCEKSDGVYVPSKCELVQKGRFLIPQTDGKKVRKAVLRDIDSSFQTDKIIVPITNVVFNRLDVEIARGCPQTCRFCQAKVYYSPFRYKSPVNNMNFILNALKNSGFDEFSISSLSSGDYPCLLNLLESISDKIPFGTSMSVSSLRPSAITEELLKTISQFRRTGLTIVPEAGSERLRQVINKNVTEEQIFQAVDKALTHKWKRIKFYFMIGLPFEQDEDIEGLIDLMERIQTRLRERGAKKMEIHASFSPFVPKPHTPFQWAPRESVDNLISKIARIKDALKRHRNIRLDFHKPYRGIVETILSRGDASVGDLIERCFQEGEIFSAWDSEFNYPVWEKAVSDGGYGKFLEGFDPDEDLPWSFIAVNYKDSHLKNEYKKALRAERTVPCSEEQCRHCGGCEWGMKEPAYEEIKKKIKQIKKSDEKNYRKFRIYFKKRDLYRHFSQLSIAKHVERIIRMAGLDCKFSEGFHPRMKLAFLQPVSVNAQSDFEIAELFVNSQHSSDEILKVLREKAGDFEIFRAEFSDSIRGLNKDVDRIIYEFFDVPSESALQELEQLIGTEDSLEVLQHTVRLTVDYKNRGQERFAKMYRVLDPEKNNVHKLIRREVIFKK